MGEHFLCEVILKLGYRLFKIFFLNLALGIFVHVKSFFISSEAILLNEVEQFEQFR